MNELRDALAAIRAGDDRAALVALLAAWTRVPDRELARAIELVGARAARGIAAPSVDEWHAAVASGDPVIRHHAVATIAEHEIQARLAQLVPIADPRVGRALVAYLCDGNHRAVYGARATFELAIAVAARDPIIADSLAGIEQRLTVPRRYKYEVSGGKALANKIRRACVAFPPLDDAARADLAALHAQLAEGMVATAASDGDAQAIEAALLAAVYATPLDDAPRAIYADWLLQRGDPRGEHITLQLAAVSRKLTDAEGSRCSELERAYRDRWYPQLAGMSGPSLARGFLSWIHLGAHDAKLAGDPALATVEHTTHLLPGTAFPGLRILRISNRDDLVRLAAMTPPPPLRDLELWLGTAGDPPELVALVRSLALPTLRRLKIGSWGDDQAPDDLLSAILAGKPITALEIDSGPQRLGAWLAAVGPTSIDTLVIRSRRWTIAATRDAQRRFAELAVAVESGDDLAEIAERFAAGLDAIAPGDLARLTLVHHKRSYGKSKPLRWLKRTRARLEAAFARHPGLAHEIEDYEPPR